MLRELAVRNLALIEDVRVELTMGFCLDGRNWRGKTLLLAALACCWRTFDRPDSRRRR